MKHRLMMMVVSVFLLVATAYLFVIIPKDFIPSQDTGQIFGFTEAAQGISFESMVEHQKAVAGVIRNDPMSEASCLPVGASGANAGNEGRIMIRLKPRSERRLSVDEVIQKLRPKFAPDPGDQGLSAESSGYSDRRSTHQKSVSVYHAGAGYRVSFITGPP